MDVPSSVKGKNLILSYAIILYGISMMQLGYNYVTDDR